MNGLTEWTYFLLSHGVEHYHCRLYNTCLLFFIIKAGNWTEETLPKRRLKIKYRFIKLFLIFYYFFEGHVCSNAARRPNSFQYPDWTAETNNAYSKIKKLQKKPFKKFVKAFVNNLNKFYHEKQERRLCYVYLYKESKNESFKVCGDCQTVH